MILSLSSAVVGVLAFAILFHAPRRSYISCALCGGISWGTFLLFSSIGLAEFPASMLAIVVLTLAARILAVAQKMPATVFIVCGIFPIVPGAGIYHTAYGLMTGDMEQFGRYGAETVALAGAIAIGIIAGMAIPQAIPGTLGRLLRKVLPKRAETPAMLMNK